MIVKVIFEGWNEWMFTGCSPFCWHRFPSCWSWVWARQHRWQPVPQVLECLLIVPQLVLLLLCCCGKWNGGGGASDGGSSLVVSELNSVGPIARPGSWPLIDLVHLLILTSFETPVAIPTLLHHDIGEFLS